MSNANQPANPDHNPSKDKAPVREPGRPQTMTLEKNRPAGSDASPTPAERATSIENPDSRHQATVNTPAGPRRSGAV